MSWKGSELEGHKGRRLRKQKAFALPSGTDEGFGFKPKATLKNKKAETIKAAGVGCATNGEACPAAAHITQPQPHSLSGPPALRARTLT